MKVLLEIEDGKAKFILKLLASFPFVKARKISSEKIHQKKALKAAIQELALIRKGEIKGIPAKQLLDEL